MVRRPLIFLGGGMVVSAFALRYADDMFMMISCLWALFASWILAGRKRWGAVVFLMAFAVGAAGGTLIDRDGGLPEEAENFTMRGEVTGVWEKESSKGDKYIQLELKGNGRVLANCYGDREAKGKLPLPGWTVEVRGSISQPEGQRNPGCFDYALYLKSRGVQRVMQVDDMQVISSRNTFKGSLHAVREKCMKSVEYAVGEEHAAVLAGLLFGDRSEMDDELISTFQKNGTAHILAVSGLHIGIIYRFILLLRRGLAKVSSWVPGEKSRVFFVVTGLFFLCYTVLADFSPSVVRAVIMVMLHMLANMTGRRYDLASGAFAVAAASLAVNPWTVFNVSFQMSFLAVLTMAVLLPYIRRTFGGLMAGGVAVQLGLGPFMVYTFNIVSPLAVFINIPVVFLAGAVIPAGLCTLMAAPLAGTVVYDVTARVTAFLCDLLIMINRGACIEGVTSFDAVSPPVWAVAAWYFVMVFFLSEEGRFAIMRKGRKCAVRAAAAVIILSVAAGYMFQSDFRDADAVFVDVGQGSCLCVRDDDRVYLFDGGGKDGYSVGEKVLKPYLLKNGMRRVDGAFVTHLHTDHYKGICELAKAGMVRKLYVYEGCMSREKEIIRDTGLTRDRIVYVHGGMRIGGAVEVLRPAAGAAPDEYNEEDENSFSLVFRMVFEGSEGITSILVTGDVDDSVEREICESWQRRGDTILSVAHHGSRFSTCEELLDRVNPVMAVIQVGRNNYGHPSPEVLGRLEDRNIPVYRNDEQGAVGLVIDEGRVKEVKTVK